MACDIGAQLTQALFIANLAGTGDLTFDAVSISQVRRWRSDESRPALVHGVIMLVNTRSLCATCCDLIV
jgi:hypothetical protein